MAEIVAGATGMPRSCDINALYWHGPLTPPLSQKRFSMQWQRSPVRRRNAWARPQPAKRGQARSRRVHLRRDNSEDRGKSGGPH